MLGSKLICVPGSERVAMPKMKTHKGLKKRVKISARGKVVFKAANAGHLMSGKSGNRRRKLRKKSQVGGPIAQRMRIALLQG
jgi:large subunit ribosomal protein L35